MQASQQREFGRVTPEREKSNSKVLFDKGKVKKKSCVCVCLCVRLCIQAHMCDAHTG